MPGPSGQGINSLLDLAQPPQQPAVNLSSVGAQMPPWYGGGYGGGGPGGAAGGYGGGAAARPPNLAQYFGAWDQPKINDPRTVAADAGVSMADLARNFFPRGERGNISYSVPNDRGGWFTAQDLFGQPQGTVEVPGPLRPGGQPNLSTRYGDVPSIGISGASAPSTNNWRLLGMGPGWIMRNGQLINTQDGSVRFGFAAGRAPGSGVSAEQPMSHVPTIPVGSGAVYGYPNAFMGNYGPPYAGWPGATEWMNPGSRDVT